MGGSPDLTTHRTLSSAITNFYPFSDLEMISPCPMLFTTGEAGIRIFSEETYKSP